MDIQELALRNAYGHLVDEIVNGNLDGLNGDGLEAFELLIAVRLLREQRDNLQVQVAARNEERRIGQEGFDLLRVWLAVQYGHATSKELDAHFPMYEHGDELEPSGD